MITKAHLISTLDKLPERLTIDQVIDHIIFVDKVQKGISDSENGRINTNKEVEQKLNKWLK